MRGQIGVVVVHYGNIKKTHSAISSLAQFGQENAWIEIVDNSATLGVSEALRDILQQLKLRGEVLPMTTNLGFAEGFNRGLAAALNQNCDAVIVLNNDACAGQGFYPAIQWALLNHEDKVWAGYVEHQVSGKPAHNIGHINPITGIIKFDFCGKNGPLKKFDYVSGCLLGASTNVWRRMGGFDASFFLYSEDYEFCLRLKKEKISLVWIPNWSVTHEVSSSVNASKTRKEYLRIRNQTISVIRHGTPFQKIGFIMVSLGAITLNLGAPRVFLELASGFLAGLLKKTGIPPQSGLVK